MKKTHEQFVLEMAQKMPSIAVLSKYSSTHEKVLVKCYKCNYEWSVEPNSLLHGIGCPACSGRVPVKGDNDLATINPGLLREWDYVENVKIGVSPDEITAHSGKRVYWMCSVCGNTWIATVDKRSRGGGCPECAKAKTTKARIDKFISERGNLLEQSELMREWDVSANEVNGLNPSKLTIKSNRIAAWKCSKCGHKWDAIIANRVKGSGCPVCSNRVVIAGKNDVASLIPELLEEWDYEKNSAIGIFPDQVAKGSEQKAFWKCSKCGFSWKTNIYSRTNSVGGTGCPECAKRFTTSIPEQALLYYIRRSFMSAIGTYKTDWLGQSEIDIYIPELSLGIEYDGEAWHLDVARDIEKNNLCQKHGIRILRVREPKCPTLPSTCDVICRSDRSYSSINQMVLDVFTFISDTYGMIINTPVNYELDRASILGFIHTIPSNSIVQFPKLMNRWDFESNGEIRPEYLSLKSEVKTWWRCPQCGYRWEAKVKDVSRAHSDCPVCSGKRIVPGINDLATKYPALLQDWDYEINACEGVFPNQIAGGAKRNVAWKCSVCGNKWRARVSNRVYGKTGCPACFEKRKSSKR